MVLKIKKICFRMFNKCSAHDLRCVLDFGPLCDWVLGSCAPLDHLGSQINVWRTIALRKKMIFVAQLAPGISLQQGNVSLCSLLAKSFLKKLVTDLVFFDIFRQSYIVLGFWFFFFWGGTTYPKHTIFNVILWESKHFPQVTYFIKHKYFNKYIL